MTLEDAYRATTYRIDHPDGGFELRVGVRSRTLDRLLLRQHLHTWAFVTAWNPFSQIVPVEQNLARQRDLEARAAHRWLSFAGVGIGVGWPAEESLLLLGIFEEEAVALARVYRQAAIIAGALGEPVRLVPCL